MADERQEDWAERAARELIAEALETIASELRSGEEGEGGAALEEGLAAILKQAESDRADHEQMKAELRNAGRPDDAESVRAILRELAALRQEWSKAERNEIALAAELQRVKARMGDYDLALVANDITPSAKGLREALEELSRLRGDRSLFTEYGIGIDDLRQALAERRTYKVEAEGAQRAAQEFRDVLQRRGFPGSVEGLIYALGMLAKMETRVSAAVEYLSREIEAAAADPGVKP